MKKTARLAELSILGSLCLGVMLPATAVGEKVFYRYQNAKGIMVQSDRLPPEVVGRGYRVVSASGDILKVVPRELTREERNRRDAAFAEQRAQEEELARMRKWDQSLILRYSGVEDIDAAKGRGIREFDTRISILQGNLMSLKAQIESEQGEAANYLRRGRKIPPALHERIAGLKAEVLYAEGAITELQQERVETEEQYEKDKLRFEFLMKQAQAAMGL